MFATLLAPLAQRINDRFTAQLVSDDDALLVFFRMLNDAEENGEAALFDAVAERLDGAIAGLVRRHAADEVRHIALTREALARLNDRPEVVDQRADLVALMDTHMGGMLSGEGSDEELGRAYLLLHALERRMVAQLTQLERGLRGRRPELARIVGSIRDDERKHIAWCGVVAWSLMGDDLETYRRVREEMIVLEAQVYRGFTQHNLHAFLDAGLSGMGWPERLFWRGAAHVMGWMRSLPVPDPDGAIAALTWEPTAEARTKDARSRAA
jgi:hypothetical protein